MVTEPVEWEDIFTNHVFDRKSIPKIYKKSLPLNKKASNPILKWTKDINRQFSKKACK